MNPCSVMTATFSALKYAGLGGCVPRCLSQNRVCWRSRECTKALPALSMAWPGSYFCFRAAQSQEQHQAGQVCLAETFLWLQGLENTSVRGDVGKRHCLEMVTVQCEDGQQEWSRKSPASVGALWLWNLPLALGDEQMDCTRTLDFQQRQRCEGRGTTEVGSVTSHAGKWRGHMGDSMFPVGLSPLQEQ